MGPVLRYTLYHKKATLRLVFQSVVMSHIKKNWEPFGFFLKSKIATLKNHLVNGNFRLKGLVLLPWNSSGCGGIWATVPATAAVPAVHVPSVGSGTRLDARLLLDRHDTTGCGVQACYHARDMPAGDIIVNCLLFMTLS